MPLSSAERSKRYREKLKENPEKHAAYLKKGRERAQKQKKINELTEREKRIKRRQWRTNQKKSRQNRRDRINLQIQLEENTPPPSPQHLELPNIGGHRDANIHSGRRRVHNRRSASYRKIQKLERELNIIRKSKDKYKKKFTRLKKTLEGPSQIGSPSPVTKMIKETKGYEVPDSVKQQLVFNNALVSQIKVNYKLNSNEQEKQVITNVLKGKITEKYHCQSLATKKIGCYAKPVLRRESKGRTTKKTSQSLHLKIRDFFERDDNTIMTPGKKQTITKGNVKKQKRLLKASLKTLYKKFCEEMFQISFATFCRHRPFWVVKPKLSDRDSCMCKKHSNMQFKLDALIKEKFNLEKEIEHLCSRVTCRVDSKHCMMNICLQCKDMKVISEIPDVDKLIKYHAWKLEKHEITKGNKNVVVKKTVKGEDNKRLDLLCREFNEELKKVFCPHVYRRNHQTIERQKCLRELVYEEAAVHMDFSENYQCKLASEIQSMHFGASHNQVTLHTVVVYTEEDTETVCSISPSRQHTPVAIWAHLMPILKKLRIRGVEIIHFFSDGPSSQYKNKENFYFLATFIKEMGFKYATWNFSEAAHGKGAPDGVGAAIKRVADGLVSRGEDISNAEEMFKKLLGKTQVTLYYISEDDIHFIEQMRSKDIIPVKGVMSIGQILFNCGSFSMKARNLSCFCKKYPTSCHCHDPIDINVIKTKDVTPQENLLDVALTISEQNYGVDDWVVVKYNVKFYPGVITTYNEDEDEFEVKTLHCVGYNKYVWPTKEDKIWYSRENILCKTSAPQAISKRVVSFPQDSWLEENTKKIF